MWLVLDNLSANAVLLNADGSSSVLAPLGSPYVSVPLGGDGILRPFETKTVALDSTDPDRVPLSYSPRVLSVVPTP